MAHKALVSALSGLVGYVMSEKNYREFLLYFEELDKQGIGYSIDDMIKKANELNLPIPEEIKRRRGLTQ